MERLRPAWLLGLPLLAIGWLSAHALAYELVAAEEHGHGYMAQAPLFLTLCAATAAVALAHRFLGRRDRAMPPWLAGLLPLAGFTLQEHLERALAADGSAWATGLEPVFLLGLLLQLPFALAALVAARALADAADAVAAREAPRSRVAVRLALPPPPAGDVPPAPALARGYAGRAPPVLA